MGCRCSERTDALRRVASAARQGDVRSGVRDVAFVGRTLIEDVRSGALKREAATRLAQLRMRRR